MAKKPSYESLQSTYDGMWDTMEIKPSWKSAAFRAAKAIHANKDKYEEVSKLTNVPWYFIGLLHKLECNLNFTQHLHNGDSLQRKTRRVPAGRPLKGNGPFTWNESAVDALTMKGFHKITDWSPAHIAYLCEMYNGWGYYWKKKHSPYLWSGSNHYTKGKFVADHKYDANAVSEQVGTMLILKALFEVNKENEVLTYKEAVKDRPALKFTERADGFFTYLGLPSMLSLTFLTDVKNFATDHAAWLLLGIAAVTFISVKYLKYQNQQTVKLGRVKRGRKPV
jgi:lysozyme family protein